MLSKILRKTEDSPVEQMRWPKAGAPGKPPAVPEARGGPQSDRREDPGQAARRIAELEQQMECRIAEARQEGFREGEAAGRGRASAEAQPALERLARSIEEIASLRPRLLRELESELVELAMGIARRILRRELSVDAEALQGLIRGALEKLSAREICRIRAHPELEPGIRRCLERQSQSGIQLIGDGTLDRGGILVETNRGKLDASLETQLAEIGRGLADRLPEK
jgi:flagellar assembly protein FliH